MSANNYILINQDNFEISINDAETGTSFGKPQKARNLENAIEIAQKIEKENVIEYGIAFTQSKIYKKKIKEKIHLYIDGTNLLAGLIDIFGYGKVPNFKSIASDFKKLFRFDIIYFYASYTPSTSKNLKNIKIKKQIKEELIFFNEVSNTPNVFFYKGYRSPTSGKEKGVDVHLAVDLVKDAFMKKFGTAIIVSGDADLAYSVEIVRKLKYKIYSLFIPNRFSVAIAYQSSLAKVIDYKSIFSKKYKSSNKLKRLNIKIVKKILVRNRTR